MVDSSTISSVVSIAEQIVAAIVADAPYIAQGVATAAPYVEAIVTAIESGGNITDQQWTDLTTRLAANSQSLQDAATAAAAQLAKTGE